MSLNDICNCKQKIKKRQNKSGVRIYSLKVLSAAPDRECFVTVRNEEFLYIGDIVHEIAVEYFAIVPEIAVSFDIDVGTVE